MYSTKHLIEIALKEDIGPGDITTENLIGPDLEGEGVIIAKEPMVIAGLEVAKQVFEYFDSQVVFTAKCQDGDVVKSAKTIAKVEGKLRILLMCERTALNFLQRLSGIATNVRSYINEVENTDVRLVDTRKTAPGWRKLEKYAVRVGGAHNHRMGLYDGVLIKDNHIAAYGGIKKAIDRIKDKISHLVQIEIEVSDLNQVEEALAAGADVIMLDNMNLQQIKKAVAVIDGKATIEVSGGITKNSLKSLADTDVDIISVGAFTHSARCVDISMRITPKK
jgi:nicotinate-nucleotide pyrophosphorylase (carboxylating)